MLQVQVYERLVRFTHLGTQRVQKKPTLDKYS